MSDIRVFKLLLTLTNMTDINDIHVLISSKNKNISFLHDYSLSNLVLE